MSLNMQGHIDDVFKSVDAVHVAKGGEYVDGIYQRVSSDPVPYKVNIQPLSEREIDFLERGGERIVDGRRIYVNSGDLTRIQLGDEWVFLGQRWKVIKTDNRPQRTYCKVIVSRIDPQ